MVPTDCYMPAEPKIVDSVCMTTGGEVMETIPIPDNAIVIKNQNFANETVDFTVNQQWILEEVGLAIQSGMDSCIIKGNVTFGDSENVEGECIYGFAGAIVIVYMDEEFEPEECEACNVDDLSEMGGDYKFCAYRVELPCEPVSVECGEPSAGPSGSALPSSEPSQSPTKSVSPSSSPSSGPSVPPSRLLTRSPTSSPSNVKPTPSSLTGPTTAPSDTPTKCPPDDPILIDINGSTMYPEGAPPIEITFQNTTHVGFKVINTWETTFTHVYTEYHEGGFGETECLEEENVESHTEVDEYMATCMHNVPISIVNVWVVDANEIYFDQIDDAEVPECCHPPEFSQVPIVQYTFKLPCVDPCPEDKEDPVIVRPKVTGSNPEEDPVVLPPKVSGSRRLHNERDENINDIASAEAFKHTTKTHISSSTANMDEPSADGKDGHFCVSEDYPCGEDNDRVHVCHYSARDGYKTFCVPESDSDVLAFYKKDYCGPCVGGYGSKIKR